MDAKTQETGKVVIRGPDDGESFWQPVPANGFVRNIFNGRDLGARSNFSIGTQTVAPNSFIREHTHADHEEIIYVVEGKGVARVDGVDHPLEVGSCVFIGVNRKHHFLNPNDEPMTFVVLLMPGGLDKFFAEIGRKRTPGEPAPEPFPRPENIAEIEARTVFGWVDASFNRKK
ncbi:MAG: cupin domain-containing protein [Rhizobiales bacterium]|nr:cupin domain-containing protein [Hyphomicrobiales bacterium]